MFKRQFDSLLKIYDLNNIDPTIFYVYISRAIRVSEFLSGIDGFNVLSVGCGVAPFAGEVLVRNAVYFGLDISQSSLHEAKMRHTEESLSLTTGDLENLPFPNSTFAMLLCLGPLEYVDNKDTALDEFSRVIKK